LSVERKSIKHVHILLGIALVFILISSGCANQTMSSPEDNPEVQSKSDQANGIAITVAIEDASGFILHSEDIENLQNELLSLGADQVEIVVESDGKTVTLNSPSELCEDNHKGLVKIYAQGDYDDLSEGLATESSYLSKLESVGFDVAIEPYINSPKS
jgi:hypothetical protein